LTARTAVPLSAQSAPALPFELSIVRSAKRKTLSIEVRAGAVTARAPVRLPADDIYRFVRQKQAWILQKIQAQRKTQAAIPVREYRDGELFPYLGRILTLVISKGHKAAVALLLEEAGGQLVITLSSRSRLPDAEQARRLVASWCQQHALALLRERTQALVTRMGLTVTSVSVKATKSRWGQCTSRGDIQYHWQIILAPDEIVDYLVAHEVCHLKHHNHSAAFWALVSSVCPHWQASRQWLRSNGMYLVL